MHRFGTLVIAVMAIGQAARAAPPLEADWLTPDAGTLVRIGACAGKVETLCGTLVWMSASTTEKMGTTDARNSDPALRTRPLLGVPVFWDLKPDGPGRWSAGKVYDARRGRVFDAKLALTPSGDLGVSGCISAICLTETWLSAKRHKDLIR